MGVFLALIVSIANLFSLTAFVPIFNTMGQEGNPRIFEQSYKDNLRYGCYLDDYGKNLPKSISIYLKKLNIVEVKKDLDYNGKVNTWKDLCNHYPDNFYNNFLLATTKFKFSINKKVESKTPGEAIVLICIVMLPVYFLKIFCLIGSVYCVGTAGLLAVRDLRMQLYQQMNKLGLDYFDKEKTGMIMSRISNDAEIVGKTLSNEFNDALVNIFYILTHLPILAILSWELLLITLIAGPLLIGPVSNFAVKIRKAFTNQQQRLAELSGHIQEVISGIRVIRAFGMENSENNRFAKINKRLFLNTFKGHYFHQVGPALTDLVASVIVIGFLAYGTYAISNTSFDKGRFMAFFFLLIFVMRPIKQVSVMSNLLNAAMSAATRIFEICDKKIEIQNIQNPVFLSDFQHEIKYENVTFQYKGTDQPALKNINISIKKGETIALVGASGAGKTTMLDLLSRFYDVSSGQISIDGINIKDLDLKQLRKSISLVSQDVYLFHTSIKENIAYGESGFSMNKIIEASKAANAHDFIMNLPNGYETQIGERGVMLSGGQKQRIAIARALVLDPPILILDEATSNLDNESEQLVQNALEKLLMGRTVLIIAHRLSTIYKSNNILVFDKGEIVESGNHQKLLERNGPYKKLFDLQFAK